MEAADYDEHARERWVADPPKAGSNARGEFVRDRARVLHSAALRRLAAKTQVVGVGQSDFPRTRLTHSLECAQIGRELGSALGADADLVDAACLAHDLGHPPFGHNGEAALDAFAASCGGFEGNAQSLRVLTRLETKVLTSEGTSAGLNLTRAVLDAATKYPWPRREGNPKYGVYADDAGVFGWLRDGAADDRRCIEAQVMDWADDVAYSVHDLEDGVHAGHVPLSALTAAAERAEVVKLARSSYLDVPSDELETAALRLVALPAWPSGFDGSLAALVALKRMTSELIARLSAAAVRATRERYGDGALRRYAGDFVVPVETRAECAILKAMADLFVMRRDEQRRDQARQREQLTALAEAILAGAPQTLEPWLRDAWVVAGDDADRVRVVVDQVASLTDTSALLWHDRLVA
ncbi:MAG TPA: deoxyguanosinetriphosphate triphosphohydrolase [Mycobacteriales bacterium]|jgi:dGTPase|nr:deoxyguanosinetriphosphate triphosphohydrolase [Mycobacteriales bacterium]